jgi:CPA2 family monovalent cation:H+ antiporter-2
MTLLAVGGAPLLLLEIGVIAIVLALLARLASGIGFSPIPLYLLVGLGIGAFTPTTLDRITVDVVTQVAVILLLFMLGLEFSGEEILGSLRTHLGSGVLDGVLNFTPGFAAGLLLGWGPVAALLLGGVTYISSSGIIAKLLDDLDRLGNLETPAVLSILVFEDMVMAVYLPLIVALLAGVGILAGAAAAAGAALALLAALWVSVRHGSLLSRGLAHRSDEVVLLTVVGILLTVGGGGEMLGISAAVAAFLVGIALSGTIAARAGTLLAPVRDLLAAGFFVLFALQIEVRRIPEVAAVAALLWLVTTLTKVFTGVWATRHVVGFVARFRAGTGLIARGEFSIVLAGLAIGTGEEPLLGPLAATYVLFTALTGPLLTRVSDPLARAWVRRRVPG